jgi:hypothetical protein
MNPHYHANHTQREEGKSVVLDVPEGLRAADGLAQTVPVLYVASEVTDSRVEDVAQ